MEVNTNTSLKDLTTMQIGGNALFVVEVSTKDELVGVIERATNNNLPFFVLGDGSNVVATDAGYDGIIILNRIQGFEIVDDGRHTTTIKVGAGENWDGIVEKTVDMHLTGIECLSGIPGRTGATPVQNVGAYGQEIADTFVELEAYDLNNKTFVTLSKEDCEFAYRSSIFKSIKNRHHVITSITLQLLKEEPQAPFYDSLQKYLDEKSVTYYSTRVIRDAVLAIRESKLPNPTLVPNSGSFFKNPLIEKWQLDDLLKREPDVPYYEMADENFKIPAGWLIEKAGLRGKAGHGFKTFETNALVIVNESGQEYKELVAFKEEIIAKVFDMFRITLEQEPELLEPTNAEHEEIPQNTIKKQTRPLLRESRGPDTIKQSDSYL